MKEAELIKDLNKQLKRQTTAIKGEEAVRDYDAKYALLYINEKYEELKKLESGMGNLPWTKNDLVNARATVSMLDIPQDNIFEFIDSEFEDIKKG